MTPWNVAELRAMVERGPAEYPGAVAVEDERGVMVFLNKLSAQRRAALAKTLLSGSGKGVVGSKPSLGRGVVRDLGKGKIVYRQLMDGDLMLTNRQPTLHKPGLMAHRARVLKVPLWPHLPLTSPSLLLLAMPCPLTSSLPFCPPCISTFVMLLTHFLLACAWFSLRVSGPSGCTTPTAPPSMPTLMVMRSTSTSPRTISQGMSNTFLPSHLLLPPPISCASSASLCSCLVFLNRPRLLTPFALTLPRFHPLVAISPSNLPPILSSNPHFASHTFWFEEWRAKAPPCAPLPPAGTFSRSSLTRPAARRRAEGYHIVHADHQFNVPTDGKPIRGLIQDHIISAVLITKRDTFFTRGEYQQLVYAACCPSNPRKRDTAELLSMPPAICKPRKLWTGKQVRKHLRSCEVVHRSLL